MATLKKSTKFRRKGDRLYYYRYNPKWKDKLPYWDRFPLMFPLHVGPKYTLGINIHWVPSKLRGKFLDFLVDRSAKIKNDKAFARLAYKTLKNTPGLRQAAIKGVRLYINNRASGIQIITRDDVILSGKKIIFKSHRPKKFYKNKG